VSAQDVFVNKVTSLSFFVRRCVLLDAVFGMNSSAASSSTRLCLDESVLGTTLIRFDSVHNEKLAFLLYLAILISGMKVA
jgi:hypothetical protein